MIFKNLTAYRGDQNSATTYEFTHNYLADDISSVRFYVRTEVDGDLLLRLSSVDHPAQWTVADNSATAVVYGADTVLIPPGNWVYDVELQLADGDTETTQRGSFTVTGDITTDLLTDELPDGLFGVTAAQKCAIDYAPQANCTNPFITVNDLQANISGLHSLMQFRATYASETGVVGGVPSQTFITDIYIIRLGVWDDLVNFQLGTADEAAWLIDNDDHHLTEDLGGESSLIHRIAVNRYIDTATELVATWDQGSATQGEALIVVDWRSIHFRSVYAEIQWESVTELIGTVPGNSLITGVYVVRLEKWSWGANSTFTIGTVADPDWLVTNTDHQLQNDLPAGETAGVVLVSGNLRYVSAPTAIQITQTTEGVYPLTGYGFVVVMYEPLPN